MAMKESEVDGQFFLGDNTPPAAADRLRHRRDTEPSLWGTETSFVVVEPGNGVLYERVLLVTKDPTTLPHSRAECAKWAYIGPAKICIGWTVQWQWFYVRAILRVSTATPADVKEIVEDCLREGAIAATIAAILTGGAAAGAAAAGAIQGCLLRKLGDQLLNVTVDLEHYWGDWE